MSESVIGTAYVPEEEIERLSDEFRKVAHVYTVETYYGRVEDVAPVFGIMTADPKAAIKAANAELSRYYGDRFLTSRWEVSGTTSMIREFECLDMHGTQVVTELPVFRERKRDD